MHGDRPSDDHVEDPLEPLPEGPDPLLDEEADAMARRIQGAAKDFQPQQPQESADDFAARKKARVDQAVRGAAGAGWNTWPHGTRSGCLDRLVVVVEQDDDVIGALRYALHHVGRSCRDRTTLVMFVLIAPHPSWRAAWLAFRQEYARQCPRVAIRVEVFGHPRLCFFDAWGRPVCAASEDGAGIYQWWRDAGPGQKELFRRRVRLLERLGVAQWATCAYKRLHTGQPNGDFQDLSFGTYGTSSQRIMKWCARIYLDNPTVDLPAGFPRQVLSPTLAPQAVVLGTAQRNQPGQPWRPTDMATFERNPAAFIDATALIARLP